MAGTRKTGLSQFCSSIMAFLAANLSSRFKHRPRSSSLLLLLLSSIRKRKMKEGETRRRIKIIARDYYRFFQTIFRKHEINPRNEAYLAKRKFRLGFLLEGGGGGPDTIFVRPWREEERETQREREREREIVVPVRQ